MCCFCYIFSAIIKLCSKLYTRRPTPINHIIRLVWYQRDPTKNLSRNSSLTISRKQCKNKEISFKDHPSAIRQYLHICRHNDYLVGTQLTSDSDSGRTVARFSRPQEYRLSECEPEHATAKHINKKAVTENYMQLLTWCYFTPQM